jgi:hypothetical protein
MDLQISALSMGAKSYHLRLILALNRHFAPAGLRLL